MYEDLMIDLDLRARGEKTGYHTAELCGLAYSAIKTLTAQLSALQSENAELTTVVKSYAVSARSIALWLRAYCDRSLPYDKMISDAAQKAASALSRVEAERDAAVKDLKEIAEDTGDGCQYCKHLPCAQKYGRCIGFVWRGAQGEG